jgi:diguanylate cyclase (GGDEF)-like protein
MKHLMMKNIKLFSTIFLTVTLVLVVYIVIDYKVFGHYVNDEALNNAIEKSKQREILFQNLLNRSQKSLTILRNMDSFKAYLAGERDTSLDQLLFYCISNDTNVMQIRYIDRDGLEKVRFDRQTLDSSVNEVVGDKLQNKSFRYYFQESKSRALNQVWFSSLDLNRERGSVEIPYNPTLRAVMPVGVDGQFEGILIINYFMAPFLKHITNLPLYKITILDGDGYVIYHEKSRLNWNKYSNYRYSLTDEFGEDAMRIIKSDFTHTQSYVSRKLDINLGNDLYIILELGQTYKSRQEANLIQRYIVTAIFTYLIAFILYLIVKSYIEKMKFQNIFSLQKNLVVIADEESIIDANDSYKQFFSIEDEQIESTECLCDKFIPYDRFFHTHKIANKENWIQTLQQLPEDEQIVSMLDHKNRPHVFRVEVNEYFNDSYIITFSQISETIKQQVMLESKVNLDPLTKAYNREFFNSNVSLLSANAQNSGKKLGVVLFDIDHFKKINDTHGHDIGDLVLRHLVSLVQDASREEDILIRWGGEEFLLLCDIEDEANLLKLAENLRLTIDLEFFEGIEHITCSFGVTCQRDNETIDETLKRADVQLYRAKADGRNRVCSS